MSIVKKIIRRIKNNPSVTLMLKSLNLELKSKKTGEIYFDKYDNQGAYHWPLYYEKHEPFYTATVDSVSDLVSTGSRVLDVGCGDGLIANVLNEKRGCLVTGVDVHPLAVTYARKMNKGRNANEFHVCSAYDIDYKNQFDTVIAIEIFEHLQKPELLLSNCYRALKENGVFIVSTPLDNKAKPPSEYHVKEYTKKEFLNCLNKLFTVTADTMVSRADGKSDCYICLCTKNKVRENR